MSSHVTESPPPESPNAAVHSRRSSRRGTVAVFPNEVR